MTDHQTLLALLAKRSARQGDFVLASGRKSNLYVDCRLTAMSPEGQLLIGRVGLAALDANGWDADSVGGLTLGADPISYAIAHASALRAEQDTASDANSAARVDETRDSQGDGDSNNLSAKLVRAFTVRKEAKQHGTGKLIEGPFISGDKVVVIEDVITTGGSALKAVASIRAAGGNVIGVLALVDREEGGREALEAQGLQVRSLALAAELVALLK